MIPGPMRQMLVPLAIAIVVLAAWYALEEDHRGGPPTLIDEP